MRKLKMPPALRTRLLVVAAVFLVPCAVLSIYLANKRSQDKLEELRVAAMGVARITALHQADSLRQVKTLLGGLATVLDGKSAACEQLLSSGLRLQSVLSQIMLANERGKLICSGKPLPVGRAEVANSELSWSQELLHRLPLPKGSHLSLVDGNGRVLARVPDAEKYVGKLVVDAAQFSSRMSRQSEAFTEGTGVDGVLRIIAYSKVPDHDLYVRVGVPKAVADEARNEVFLATLAIVALVLSVVLVAGWVVSRRLMVDPVLALQRAALRLGATDIAARTGLSHDGSAVGDLAQKLDELAALGQRVTRALRTLSAGNQTLLRERKDEKDLLRAMCRVAVEKGGYLVAMVNYPRSDGSKIMDVVAACGDEAFARSVVMTYDESATSEGTVGRCMKSGEPAVSHSYAADPRLAAWRDLAIPRGYRSVISLPLRVCNDLIGTFTLIAGEEDAFDEDEVELLKEMAADLSFGVEAIRGESRRKEAEANVARALTLDALVDLPNRPTFIRMVMAAISSARRGGQDVAILAIHIGRLQEIFDSFGYEAYRAVLKEIAARLATVPACHDSSARLPMEEFGVLLPSKDPNILGVIADRLLAVFKAPILIGSVQLDVRAAVGVSFFPEHGDDGESLIRRASLVARDAFKREVSFQVFSGKSERERPQQLALAAELRAAIDADKLALWYQPKVRISDGATVGYEALARWFDPFRGDIAPGIFVPLAEQMGMIGPMTNRIMRMAVRQSRDWLSRGLKLPVAVNLSARNLYDPLTITNVERWLKTYNVPAALLHFEITEGALVEDPQSARGTLNRLRALGSKIYIDDFGTGYSSLSYLATLPVNSLKIDRSFVDQMMASQEARSIVSSIISMAHNLKMSVIAEGVETTEQLSALRQLDCDEAQGYLFGKPVPSDQV